MNETINPLSSHIIDVPILKLARATDINEKPVNSNKLSLINPSDLEIEFDNSHHNKENESPTSWFNYVLQFADIISLPFQQTTRLRIEEVCSETDRFGFPVETLFTAYEIKEFFTKNQYGKVTKILVTYYGDGACYAYLDIYWAPTTQSLKFRHKLNTQETVETPISSKLIWKITTQSKEANLLANTMSSIVTYYCKGEQSEFNARNFESFEGKHKIINEMTDNGIPLPTILYRNAIEEFVDEN